MRVVSLLAAATLARAFNAGPHQQTTAGRGHRRAVQSPPIPLKTPVGPASAGEGVTSEESLCPFGFGASTYEPEKDGHSAAFGIPQYGGMLPPGDGKNEIGWVMQRAPRGQAQSSEEYEQAVLNLDVAAVQQDLITLFTKSDPRWPADYGNYGPLMIRLAWHCAGTYRITDGRGGCSGGRQRFDLPDGVNPGEASWEDNTNLDKARMLLEPIKEKYGLGLSYGDLYILAGTTAIQWMQGPTLGVCLGRVDDVDGANSVPLGPSQVQNEIANCGNNSKTGQGNYATKEDPEGYDFHGDDSFNNDCTSKNPVTGANKVGLIYVNPEGVNGESPPTSVPINAKATPEEWKVQAEAVRRTFARMGMSDEETAALIGGGHSFGKAHGACPLGAGDSPLHAKQKLKAAKVDQGLSEEKADAEVQLKLKNGHDNYEDFSSYNCAPGFKPAVENDVPCTASDVDCCVPQESYVWQGECGEGAMKGKGPNARTSGLEGPWTVNPVGWDNSYWTNLLNYDWKKTKSPGGATQWTVVCPGGRNCEEPNDPGPIATGAFGGYQKIMMLTTDMILVNEIDGYRKYVEKFASDSVAFDKAWANAWHKLTTVNFGTNKKPVCYTRGGDLVESVNGMFYGFSPNPLVQTRTECSADNKPDPSFGTNSTGVADPSYDGQPKFDPSALGGPAGYSC